MNLESITDFYSVNPPASEQAIAEAEFALGKTFPPEYRSLLLAADGFILQTGIGIYGTDEVEERNKTFEVEVYAPGYLAIGDDSGGRVVLLRYEDSGVYLVHQGIMAPQRMKLVANSLTEWVESSCEIE